MSQPEPSELLVMQLYSLFNGYMEHINPTATLSWLGSSHAKGSYITLHKKSDFCQLLRNPSPKCVKLLRRLKGQKDLIFFSFPEMPHQTEFLNIHSFQKERHLRCLGGLGNLTSCLMAAPSSETPLNLCGMLLPK